MRTFLLIALASGCGGPKPTTTAPASMLEGAGSDGGVGSGDAMAFAEATAEVPAGPRGPYPDSGPPCMPAGRYNTKWDFSAATFKQGAGAASPECRQLAELVPEQNMRTMYVDFTNGKLVVHWPNLVDVVVKSECAFEVDSLSVHVAIKFEDGKATGSARYTIGTPNHPEENCAVEKVGVAFERARY